MHGGPGSGSSPGARCHFDPAAYQAVLFDQRGCGRSRPLASELGADLRANTTDHLVADLERLRKHLGIGRWVVAGISWGATLALVYAQRHPERVLAMALGAVTTSTRREIEWITRDVGRIFPREWAQLLELVPQQERSGDLAAAYARLLENPDRVVREDAARAWCAWEDIHVSMAPDWTPNPRYHNPTFRMVFARLVTHYWSHDCFLGDGEILARMPRLATIPGVLIHGRYDVSSPLDTAWALRDSWPASKLVILDDAGHGGGGFPGELAGALDSFRDLRRPPGSGTSAGRPEDAGTR